MGGEGGGLKDLALGMDRASLLGTSRSQAITRHPSSGRTFGVGNYLDGLRKEICLEKEIRIGKNINSAVNSASYVSDGVSASSPP